jgi:hypothetical protein
MGRSVISGRGHVVCNAGLNLKELVSVVHFSDCWESASLRAS